MLLSPTTSLVDPFLPLPLGHAHDRQRLFGTESGGAVAAVLLAQLSYRVDLLFRRLVSRAVRHALADEHRQVAFHPELVVRIDQHRAVGRVGPGLAVVIDDLLRPGEVRMLPRLAPER